MHTRTCMTRNLGIYADIAEPKHGGFDANLTCLSKKILSISQLITASFQRLTTCNNDSLYNYFNVKTIFF